GAVSLWTMPRHPCHPPKRRAVVKRSLSLLIAFGLICGVLLGLPPSAALGRPVRPIRPIRPIGPRPPTPALPIPPPPTPLPSAPRAPGPAPHVPARVGFPGGPDGRELPHGRLPADGRPRCGTQRFRLRRPLRFGVSVPVRLPLRLCAAHAVHCPLRLAGSFL